MIDDKYTLADHEAREDDPYAKAKYDLTLRWLQSAGICGMLLNIGCGGGLFNEMAHDAGFDVVGLEPDKNAYKLAVDSATGKYRVFNVGLFDDVDVGSPNVIVMHDVLEHIESESAAVARLAHLMSDDAVAIVSVPAMQWLFGYHDRQLGHYRRYTERSLRRALADDFDVTKIRYLGLVMIPVALWYSRIRNRPYPVGAVGGGMKAIILEALCNLESRFAGPAGTSVVALVRLKRASQTVSSSSSI